MDREPHVQQCLLMVTSQSPRWEKRVSKDDAIPEELEAHSLPVSLSLSPSLVSATAEAGAFEQEALTTWCLRRRLPEHLDLGLCSAANSFAPSCKQSRTQIGGMQSGHTERPWEEPCPAATMRRQICHLWLPSWPSRLS